MLPVKTFEDRVISNSKESGSYILDRLYTLHPQGVSTLTAYTLISGIPPEADKGLYALLLSILEDQQQKFLNALEPSEN
jgi:hypothetical protein